MQLAIMGSVFILIAAAVCGLLISLNLFRAVSLHSRSDIVFAFAFATTDHRRRRSVVPHVLGANLVAVRCRVRPTSPCYCRSPAGNTSAATTTVGGVPPGRTRLASLAIAPTTPAKHRTPRPARQRDDRHLTAPSHWRPHPTYRRVRSPRYRRSGRVGPAPAQRFGVRDDQSGIRRSFRGAAPAAVRASAPTSAGATYRSRLPSRSASRPKVRISTVLRACRTGETSWPDRALPQNAVTRSADRRRECPKSGPSV